MSTYYQHLYAWRDELMTELYDMRPENVAFIGNEFFLRKDLLQSTLDRINLIIEEAEV